MDTDDVRALERSDPSTGVTGRQTRNILDLPHEIREIVLRYLLDGAILQLTRSTRPCGIHDRKKIDITNIAGLGLLPTCLQLRSEYQYLLSKVRLCPDIDIHIASWEFAFFNLPVYYRNQNINMIKSITVTGGAPLRLKDVLPSDSHIYQRNYHGDLTLPADLVGPLLFERGWLVNGQLKGLFGMFPSLQTLSVRFTLDDQRPAVTGESPPASATTDSSHSTTTAISSSTDSNHSKGSNDSNDSSNASTSSSTGQDSQRLRPLSRRFVLSSTSSKRTGRLVKGTITRAIVRSYANSYDKMTPLGRSLMGEGDEAAV